MRFFRYAALAALLLAALQAGLAQAQSPSVSATELGFVRAAASRRSA